MSQGERMFKEAVALQDESLENVVGGTDVDNQDPTELIWDEEPEPSEPITTSKDFKTA